MLFVKNVHVVNGCVSLEAIDNYCPSVKYTALFKKNGEIVRYAGKTKKEIFSPSVEDFLAEEFFRFCSRYAKEQEELYMEVCN